MIGILQLLICEK